MADSEAPLTLPVANLSASTSLYLAALHPLGYRFISHAQHQTAFGSSQAVGIGPDGTTRVDLFLSQSGRTASDINQGRSAHVVFPATSTRAVREFYTAALHAGARPCIKPDFQPGGEGIFSATVTDIDGNKIEVSYAGGFDAADHDSAGASQPTGTIRRWAESVVSSSAGSRSKGSETSRRASDPRQLRYMPASQPVPTARAASHTSSKPSTRSRSASGSVPKSKSEFPVVGTIIGAAASAALAYTMVRSKQDSVAQERDFSSRMAAKERLKAEARAHAAAVDGAYYGQTRKGGVIDRDSGYYSGGSYHHERTPSMLKRRSATYPFPEDSDNPDPRSSRPARRVIEYPPPSDTLPSRAGSGRRESASGSSQSTARPLRRSNTSTGSRSNYSEPSMPPMPATRSRRESRQIYEPPSSGRAIADDSRPPPPSYEVVHRTRPSRQPSVDRSPPTRTRLVHERAPPSAALTAKALSKVSRDVPVIDASKLDDMATIVPDDSISCISERPAERRRRSSRSQW